MILDVASITDKGPCRDINQDSIYEYHDDNMGIFVVADGMGGHSEGEKASGDLVREMELWWEGTRNMTKDHPIEKILEDCIGSVKFINKRIFDEYKKKKEIGGSTLVVLIISGDEYATVSVGDSRAYKYSNNELMQITEDDVWENLPDVVRKYSQADILNDERYGRLTEAVGAYNEVNVRTKKGMILSPSSFMLCSDGIYKYTSHEDLEKSFAGPAFGSSSSIMKKIKKKVIKGGAGDNYSCIICKVTPTDK
jgi:serine/threonine protein phosphatase PrpC